LKVVIEGVKKLAEFFALRLKTLEMFWPTLQQPTKLWTNGGYSWIQQVRKV
jgi:hypothetical protein